MKHLLFISTIALVFNVQAQEYCGYNDHITLDMGVESDDEPTTVIIQPDGKILGVGTTYYTSSNHFEASLFRMNPDLTPDDTFGINGRIGHTWEQRNTATSAALDDQGRIYIGGYQAPGNGVSSFRGYVGRLNSDGSVDTSFATLGSKKFEIMPGLKGLVVGIQPLESGGVKVAMITGSPAGGAVIQLTEEGEPDSLFSSDGYALFQDNNLLWQHNYGDAIFLDNDTSVVIMAKALVGGAILPYVAKVESTGVLDTAFSQNGTIIFPQELPGTYAGIFGTQTQDEDILVTCSNSLGDDGYRVYKIDGETGELVSDFGTDGISYASSVGIYYRPWDILVHPDNNDILVIGSGSNGNYYPTIWRINENGEEISNCGGTASQTFTEGLDNLGYKAAAFTDSGELQFLGQSYQADPESGEDQVKNFMFPTVLTPSSIHENYDGLIGIYPNPSTDIIYFDPYPSEVTRYQIINMQGAIARQGMISEAIDVSSLPEGLYQLILNTAQRSVGSTTFIKR